MSFVDPIDNNISGVLKIFDSLSQVIQKDTNLVQGITEDAPGTVGEMAKEGITKTTAHELANYGIIPQTHLMLNTTSQKELRGEILMYIFEVRFYKKKRPLLRL